MNGALQKNNLFLRNIHELLGEVFFIPAYQRGYRWSAMQVKELLDDIWEFSQKKDKDNSSFYCLQPVVVVRSDSSWQVVDGQQRLTTLFIILRYLEQEHLRRSFEDAFKKNLYTIEYETRKNSKEFLQNIDGTYNDDNIDFFHMSQAYKAVADWFGGKNYNDNNAFLATLLADQIDTRSVKVIWYDLTEECTDNDNAIDVFTRINIGKIPLTNAELVKALFLQNTRFQKNEVKLKQIHIASEWDAIEKRLQEPGFWHFIYRTNQEKDYSTRIEYIFDLMKEKKVNDETFFTFHKFSNDFKKGNEDIHDLWQKVKKYFLTFEEWYRDREIYHLIGFLVDCGRNIATIKSKAEKVDSKKEFKIYLYQEISKEVECDLSQLNYGDSRVKKVLLLFNILTLLSTKESDARFPFDRYKHEKWDIEHIRSQTDNIPSNLTRVEWLKDVHKYFNKSPSSDKKSQAFFEKITKLLHPEAKIGEEAFILLYQEIREYFSETEEVDWVNGLGNLTLLDAATNRSYGNSMFPIKRARIIENDKRGVFVPICTKNAFLKFYSESPDELTYWKRADAHAYLANINNTLFKFTSASGKSNGK